MLVTTKYYIENPNQEWKIVTSWLSSSECNTFEAVVKVKNSH